MAPGPEERIIEWQPCGERYWSLCEELKREMRILTIDTATPFGVLGLTEDGMPKGEIRFTFAPGGSERLPSLQQLLEQVAWLPSQLQLIVVGLGPGSYTGIRVGVAFAVPAPWLGVPMVGVPTQAAVAETGARFAGTVCVLFDARRETLCVSLFFCRKWHRYPGASMPFGPEPFPWKVWWGGQ